MFREDGRWTRPGVNGQGGCGVRHLAQGSCSRPFVASFRRRPWAAQSVWCHPLNFLRGAHPPRTRVPSCHKHFHPLPCGPVPMRGDAGRADAEAKTRKKSLPDVDPGRLHPAWRGRWAKSVCEVPRLMVAVAEEDKKTKRARRLCFLRAGDAFVSCLAGERVSGTIHQAVEWRSIGCWHQRG